MGQRDERGQVLALLAIGGLGICIGLLAIISASGAIYQSRTAVQSCADSAALAGAATGSEPVADAYAAANGCRLSQYSVDSATGAVTVTGSEPVTLALPSVTVTVQRTATAVPCNDNGTADGSCLTQ